jgi:hypothetical protein
VRGFARCFGFARLRGFGRGRRRRAGGLRATQSPSAGGVEGRSGASPLALAYSSSLR